MNGIAADPLAWSAITATVGGGLWIAEHHFQRVTAWMFTLSTALLVTGWGELRAALAALLLTGKGMLILVVLAIIFGGLFYLGGVRTHKKSWFRKTLLSRKAKPAKNGQPPQPAGDLVPWVPSDSPRPRRGYHHRVWTHVAGMVTGALAVIVVGGARLLAAAGGASLANTGRQFITSTHQISSGQAAAAVPASHRPGIYMAAGGILLLIILVMRSVDKRLHGGKKQGRGQAPQPPALSARMGP